MEAPRTGGDRRQELITLLNDCEVRLIRLRRRYARERTRHPLYERKLRKYVRSIARWDARRLTMQQELSELGGNQRRLVLRGRGQVIVVESVPGQ